jgi:peptide/nickel transport system substrate-binding protein
MRRKLWLSVAMLVIGTGLLVAAGTASGAGQAKHSKSAAKAGGTLRVNLSATDVDFVDPALSYFAPGWQIEYSTCLKLLNYPDAGPPRGSQIIPEASNGFPRISHDGKTYTFNVRKGMKFSNGKTVTAANFAAAFNRDLNPAMQSPAAQFIADIVGADAVLKGKAKKASGVKVSGSRLTIKLTKAAPDFTARLAMPFFCAIPTNLPINPQGVNSLPAAGPYYIKSRTPNGPIVLARNTFYKGARPQGPNQIVYTVNTDLNQSLLEVKQGTKDYDAGGLPPTAVAQLGAQFGVNKGRFFVHPIVETDYVALNTSRPLFGNLKMRQAVNYAIDRPAMLRQRGAYAGQRNDQILPPGMPGYRDTHTYPIQGANPTKAKQISGGKGGTVQLYHGSAGVGPLQAQVLQFNLKQMGLDVSDHAFTTAVMYAKAGTKGEPFDAVIAGWSSDYADPFDFIDVLLNGGNIHATNNNNLAYFNTKSFNAKMNAASRLVGNKRYARYGLLDVDITAHGAPWAAFDNRNVREFVSTHVKNFVFQPVYGAMDLNAVQIR